MAGESTHSFLLFFFFSSLGVKYEGGHISFGLYEYVQPNTADLLPMVLISFFFFFPSFLKRKKSYTAGLDGLHPLGIFLVTLSPYGRRFAPHVCRVSRGTRPVFFFFFSSLPSIFFSPLCSLLLPSCRVHFFRRGNERKKKVGLFFPLVFFSLLSQDRIILRTFSRERFIRTSHIRTCGADSVANHEARNPFWKRLSSNEKRKKKKDAYI